MSVRSISTNPIQVATANPNRHSITVQLIPKSIAAGNTGFVYGKFGSAPVASATSNTWDFVLNAGALDGSNLYEAAGAAHLKMDLWLIADTADQQVNVVERSLFPVPAASDSGAAAA